MEAYAELEKWTDKTVTKEYFMKGLHLTIKERNAKVVPKLIKVMIDLFSSEEAESLSEKLDLKRFLTHYCEHIMYNAKTKLAKANCLKLIPIIFKVLPNDKMIEGLKNLLATIKPKIQTKALVFILELVKAGKVVELEYLKKFYSVFEKTSTSRTAAIRKSTMEILKETYYYMGEGLLAMMGNFKEAVTKELTAWTKTVDPKKMKIIEQKGGKKIDAYDLAEEVTLPKEFTDDEWYEEVISLKKWKEKNQKLNELITILSKAKKLNPKTKTQNFIHLAQKLFMENIVINQVAIIKIIGFCASALRKNFLHQAKQIISTLFTKLKEKNRQLSEEILNTLEKFYLFMSLDDTLDEYRDNLKDKSNDKKKNILTLILRLLDKGLGVKNKGEAKKMVKIMIGLLEESDSTVRNRSAEVIGKMKDKYNDSIMPLLSDLNPQKLKMILKHCSNQAGLIATGVDEADTKGAGKKKTKGGRGKGKKMIRDKLELIKEVREELFSNRTVKISDKSKFAGFLNTKLRGLSAMTKEFTELSNNQMKEICGIVDDLCQKIDKESFTEPIRKMLVTFFLEQSNLKASNELFRSMQMFIDSKLITAKTFLLDTYEIIFKKNTKINKEFLIMLVRLLETELISHRSLKAIAHKQFVEFVKAHFSNTTTHVSIRLVIVNFMKTIEKKFGPRHLAGYPSNLQKELEQQNIENQKMLKKFLDKLNDRNNDRRRSAIEELINTRDPQRIKYYWAQTEFLNYLKRLLIQEKEEGIYSFLVEILEKYLDMYQSNSVEFSLKNYLYVFQIIISNYANREDAGDMYIHIDKLFHKTVKSLTPNTVFYELMNDKNNASMREDILNFYLLYHLDITPDISFIDWLAKIVNDKDAYRNELKSLVDNVLLTLKATDNDELIIKGAQNKHIRDIWHMDEEDIIFDREILQRESIFDSVSKFRTIKRYLMENLKLDEEEFYAKTIDRLLKEDPEFKRAKLVFYMIKAYDNTRQIAENVFADLRMIEWIEEEEMDVLICVKIIFVLLKNNIFDGTSHLFNQLRNFLIEILQHRPEIEDNFEEIFSPNSFEFYFFGHLVNSTHPVGFQHRFGNVPNMDKSVVEEGYANQAGFQSANNVSNIYHSNLQGPLGSTSNFGVNTSQIGPKQSNYGSNRQSFLARRDHMTSQKSLRLEGVDAENRSTYGTFFASDI